MNPEEEFKSKEKFYEFIKGNGFYAVLAIVILFPLGLHFLAYKKPIKPIFYANIVVGLILLAYGIYVIVEYRSILSIYESAFTNALSMLSMLPAEELSKIQQEIEKEKEAGRQKLKEDIGNRCMALGSISIIIGLVSIGWNIYKLKSISV